MYALKTMEAIEATHKKVDTALKAGGDAVGAQTVIATMPGQLPLACNNRLNELFVTNAKIAEPNVALKTPDISVLQLIWVTYRIYCRLFIPLLAGSTAFAYGRFSCSRF